MTKHKRIHNLVDKFLETCVKSDGSWQEVSRADMEMLYKLMDAIIDKKWPRDCDGDSVINFQFIDRKKYEPNHFHLVPYDHKGDPDEVLEKRIFNIDVASDQLRRTINHRRMVNRSV